MALQDPIYDPNFTYEENLERGPFGEFANEKTFQMKGEPEHTFLGHAVYLPLGIPAGPLPNANFVIAAFKKGFDIPTYKTVRTREKETHQAPNIVPVKIEGDLTLEKASKGLVMDDNYHEPIAITNSFGVGSFDPDVWQPDMKKAVEAAGKGQVMIASGQGTGGEGPEKLIEDYAMVAKLMKEAGAPILELNLSCPNEGKAKLLCHDTDMVEKVAFAAKEAVGDTPVLLKLSYFENDEILKDFVERLSKIVDGFVAINTIAGEVRKPDGEQALPGEGRLRSGVCGAPIKWAGVEMTERMNHLRREMGRDFVIVGSGGVTTPADYNDYRMKGADAVMTATGMMWNPWLAKEIKEFVGS